MSHLNTVKLLSENSQSVSDEVKNSKPVAIVIEMNS